ncbi:hypothetical protein [Halorubrum xinjiangense]
MRPDPQTDMRPDPQRDSGSHDSVSHDGPALLAATPDADAVFDRLRTLAVLAGFLALLVTLIAAELLVRI